MTMAPINDDDRKRALDELHGMLFQVGFYGQPHHEAFNLKMPNGDLVWYAVYKHFRDGKNVGHTYDALDIDEATERVRTCNDPIALIVSLTGMRPVCRCRELSFSLATQEQAARGLAVCVECGRLQSVARSE